MFPTTSTRYDFKRQMTKSKRPVFRFSLSTLLLVVTSVGLFFGYAHWRRVSISREDKELEARGVRLLWAESSPDGIWPVVPKKAAFEYKELSANEVEIASIKYALEDAKVYCDATWERLNRLGVEEVVIVKNGRRTNTWLSTK